MSKIYAQIVDNVVNLIGGNDVGLPHNFINDKIQVIDITDIEEKPQEGWFYVNGEFLSFYNQQKELNQLDRMESTLDILLLKQEGVI